MNSVQKSKNFGNFEFLLSKQIAPLYSKRIVMHSAYRLTSLFSPYYPKLTAFSFLVKL
jgi:hypothetical protein